MKKILLLISLLCLLPSGSDAAHRLSREECNVIVKDFERTSNHNPADIEARGRRVLEVLREGETLTPYFVAFNIYAENLFNHGHVEEAQKVIAEMLDEAAAQEDVECKVIALRTEGQLYYKLGLYEQAADCFSRAMEMCPRYDSEELEHCFTWSSTLFWLVQTSIHTGQLEQAEHWLSQMDGMMTWLDAGGSVDSVGYKPVMIRGLKARIELQRGNREAAVALLDECPQFIREDVPSRAYVEYYVARMQLALLDGRHDEALPLLDELIDMHLSDYKPIAAQFLYQKGMSLAQVGRFEESARALMAYIELTEQVNRMSLAEQLGELSARYEVEKLQHERDNMERRLIIVIAICVALAVIFTLVVVSRKRLRRKNKTLADTISELNRRDRRADTLADDATAETSAAATAELLETGHKIVEYINRTSCYLSPDCSRDTIKEGLGVTERVMAKAIVAATGLSFVNYVNRLRLKVSIEMLEEKPEMTINDISTACGFGTVRQFQRIFKQSYDMSPSAYREARRSTSPDNVNP